MKKYFLFCTVFITLTIVRAQTTFQKTFGTSKSERGYYIKESKDKGFIILAINYQESYVYIVKLDSSGKKLWSKDLKNLHLSGVIQTKDEGYLFFGGGAYLIKTDPSGNIAWQRAYNNVASFASVAEDLDGKGYILLGWNGYTTGVIMKTDFAGNIIWTGTSTLPSGFHNLQYSSLVQSKSDSSFLLVGTYLYGGTYTKGILSKFSKKGLGIWNKSVSVGSNPCYQGAGRINPIYNGNYLMSFRTCDGLAFIELDTSGTPLNTVQYPFCCSTSYEFANPTVDRSMYFTTGTPISYPMDIMLSKTNSSGDFVWSKKIGGKHKEENGELTVSSNGDVFIAGTTRSFGAGMTDLYLAKVSKNGITSCNSDTISFFPAVTPKIAVADSFACTFGIINSPSFINGNLSLPNSIDTSYNACGCVPPKAVFSTGYPAPNGGGVIDSSTWAETYIWDNGDGKIDSTISCTSCTYNMINGVYTICLKVINACGRDSVCHPINYVYTPVSVSEDFTNSITISPNPFSYQTVLQIKVTLNNATLTLDNFLGQTVKQLKNISGQTVVLLRDDLASGMYFVRLTEENKIYTGKLIITDR